MLLFHNRTRGWPIELGNDILAAEDRAATRSKPFSWNYLVDVTKSVLVL